MSIIDMRRETLRHNVVEQAAAMLLQHVKFNKHFHSTTKDNNTNAFDEHRNVPRRKQNKRTDKCNSWLSTFTTKSDSSISRYILKNLFGFFAKYF